MVMEKDKGGDVEREYGEVQFSIGGLNKVPIEVTCKERFEGSEGMG